MRVLRRIVVFASFGVSACVRPVVVAPQPAEPVMAAMVADDRSYVTLLQPAPGDVPAPEPDERRRGLVTIPPLISVNINLKIFREQVGLRFDLFENVSVLAIIDRVEPVGDGRLRVSATRVCEPSKPCPPGRVFLTVGTNGLSIYFRLPGAGDITVDRFESTKLLAIQHAATLPLRCSATAGWLPWFDVMSAPPAGVTSEIDVGVLYTRQALCGKTPPETCTAEELQTLNDQLQNWTTSATEALQRSYVNAKVNIVALEEIDANVFKESDKLAIDLENLDNQRKDAGKAVLAFRRGRRADVVFVLVSNAGGDNGLAKVFRTWFVKSFADHATGVMVRKSAFTNHVMTHELGHVLGGGHERGAGRGRFWYSHGKVIRLQSQMLHTIMATGNAGRIDRFSSPEVRFDGRPTGTWHENMVKTLNKTRRHVEDFQARQVTSTSKPE